MPHDGASPIVPGHRDRPNIGTQQAAEQAPVFVLIETGRIGDTLRDDVLALARGYIADVLLTAEELNSLAAEPLPARTCSPHPESPLFCADPDQARDLFIDLIGAVNFHAPETVATWLQAACQGLAARLRYTKRGVPQRSPLLRPRASALQTTSAPP